MCTLAVSVVPDHPRAVVLAAVRDEFLGRAWDPPARHWPDRPTLLGGRDRVAGGTWLAVDPQARRVGCVLNAAGRRAPEAGRRSRGGLPLLAAAGAAVPDDLTRYDPFHLVTVDPTGLRVLTWNGHQPHEYRAGAGTYLFVNHGRWTGPTDRRTERASYHGPRFARVRPDPVPGADIGSAWSPWLELIDAPELAADDPRALVMRREVAGGSYGTSSISLLAFGVSGQIRYDFRPGPGQAPWRSVAV